MLFIALLFRILSSRLKGWSGGQAEYRGGIEMKRSEINGAVRRAMRLLEREGFRLPEFGYWTLADWRANRDRLESIRKTMLGWDVTDFSSGDFPHTGSVLFTLRNGSLSGMGTPYAEKLIFQLHETEQEIPFHFHRTKTEDIINRGGGILRLQLYASRPDGTPDREMEVEVYRDGIRHEVPAGAVVEVPKGCSITLVPGLYHRFWAKKGAGDLIAGEVSSVNDDRTDNRFLQQRDRFSVIEEDEEILYPLCNEYERLLFSDEKPEP